MMPFFNQTKKFTFVAANRTGQEREWPFTGGSCVFTISPNKTIRALDTRSEKVLYETLQI
jgi:hypothetical protein